MSSTSRILSYLFTSHFSRRSIVSSSSCNISVIQNCWANAQTSTNINDESPSNSELTPDIEGAQTGNDKRFIRRPKTLMPSQKFRTEERFLTHFNRLKSTGDIIDNRDAFILLKSLGKHMVSESPSTKNRLLQQVWSEFETSGVVLNTHLWNTLLSVYIENGFEFEPVDFLREMWQKSNAEPNHTTFTLMVQSYAIKGDPIGAMKIVEFMLKNNEQITEVIYGWLIHAFAKNGDTDDIDKIFDSMLKNNISPRHAVYEQLINVYAEKGDFDNIEKTMGKMISKGIYPTSSTYLNMLEHAVKGNNSHILEKIWNKIDDTESLISELFPLTLNCITSGDFGSALFLLEKSSPMKAKNVRSYQDYIERRMFSFMKYANQNADSFVKASSSAKKYYKSGQRSGKLASFVIDSGDDDFSANIFQCLKEGGEVKASDFIPFIKELERKDEVDKIIKLCNLLYDYLPMAKYFKYTLQSILENKSKENAELASIINLIFTGNDYNKTKNPENLQLVESLVEIKNNLDSSFDGSTASEIISKLHKNGVSNDFLVRDLVLKLNAKDHTEEALIFLKNIVQDNVTIDSPTFTKMLKMLLERRMKDSFFSFVYFMKENGIEVDKHQLYQMLIMSSLSGDGVAAQYCFEKLKDDDFVQKQMLYNYLISAYSNEIFKTKANFVPIKLSKSDTAIAHRIIHIFNEMIESGFDPGSVPLLTVIKNYLFLNDVESALEIAQKYSFTLNKKLHPFVLRAYSSREDFVKAEEYFSEVPSSENSVYLCNEMLKVYFSTVDVERADSLISEMSKNGINPNSVTHKYRILILSKAGRYEEILSVIEDGLVNRKFLKTFPIDKTMLWRYVSTGNTEFLTRLFDMTKQHLNDESILKQLSISSVLAHVNNGNFDEASVFYQSNSQADEDVILFSDTAQLAYKRNNITFLKNLAKFLKLNKISCSVVDEYYMKLLDRTDKIEELQLFYTDSIESGLNFDDKFMGQLDEIIERRGLVSFQK